MTEVTKTYAFKQGCGGMTSSFNLSQHGHPDFENSVAYLTETQEENNTNAYMLIYVRETERNEIMTDILDID